MKDWRKIWNLLCNYIRSWLFISVVSCSHRIKHKGIFFFTCCWMLEKSVNGCEIEMDAAHCGDIRSLSWLSLWERGDTRIVIIFIHTHRYSFPQIIIIFINRLMSLLRAPNLRCHSLFLSPQHEYCVCYIKFILVSCLCIDQKLTHFFVVVILGIQGIILKGRNAVLY